MRDSTKNTILGIRFTKRERERITEVARSIHPELKPSAWVRHVAVKALEAETEQQRKVG